MGSTGRTAMRERCWVSLLLLCLPRSSSRASISENGYAGVVIAVSPEESENPALVESIKKLFTSASAELYGATRQRAFFSEVTILVPQSWSIASEPSVDETFEDAEFRLGPSNPVYGNNPYTVQNRDCGDPGDFTHLTSWFVLNHATNASTEFGRTDKVIVHEWAKLRWGVFEEFGYPGDERFPMFYFKTTWGPNGQEDVLKPNFCTSTEVEGESRDVVTGGECSNDPDSGLPDSRCYFFPRVESTVASSYMALPFLDSVTDFCDQTEANLHHAEIPTKHNLYCDGRSTWDVIKEHDDFDDELNPANPDILDTTPFFRVVQSKKPKYVVLMDVSTSMEIPGNDQMDLFYVRSENLKNAVKRWVMYEVTDGTEVALVVFSNVEVTNGPPIIFPMAAVNDETRAEMVEAVDNMEFNGLTCIGCGIDRALNWDGALMGVNGGVIILITDGKQECEIGEGNPTVCKTIESMTPQVLERQTRVVTIAFGLEADPALEDLALQSGGKSYFIDDYSGPGSINDAFTGSMTYQPGDVLGESTTTVHQNDHQNVVTGAEIKSFFDIDVSIGREVTFQITINAAMGQDCTSALTITLLKPDEEHTPELDKEPFTCSSENYKTYRHTVLLAQEGRWVYEIVASEALVSISVKVESKSRDPSTDPVMSRCWISSDGQELDTTTNVKLAVVAEVSQGSAPVVGARVEAVVERPMDSNNNPQAPIQLELLDNGGGADKIRNDGTYSRYFTQYTGKGRYSVKCQVTGNEDTGVNGGFIGAKVFPKVPDPHSPLCCGSDAMPPGSQKTPTGNFSRQAAGGAFQVTNEVDLSVDNFPPGRVTDLAVANSLNTVNLNFTSPGDDLDSNQPVASYIIKYSSTAANLTGLNFDKEEFNFEITANDLVDSDLSPVNGGAVKKINIKSMAFSAGTKYVIALKAVDNGSNQSPVSNMVQIFLPALDETTTVDDTTTADDTTTIDDTTTMDDTTTVDGTATSTTSATTTTDLLPISTELTIGISAGVFLGSFAATLLVMGAVYWYRSRYL